MKISRLYGFKRSFISLQNEKRAEMFVADFIIPQLVAKDINELWTIHNPMGLLVALLKAEGRGEPEPRLLWSSAKNTIMAVHLVGIYSDKKLIGKCKCIKKCCAVLY